MSENYKGGSGESKENVNGLHVGQNDGKTNASQGEDSDQPVMTPVEILKLTILFYVVIGIVVSTPGSHLQSPIKRL